MIDPFNALHAQCFTQADIDAARQEGRDEVLKLAAKIVSKLEVAMMPDFATQIEQGLRDSQEESK